MPIDPTIAVRIGQSGVNLADIMMDSERIRAAQQDRETKAWDSGQKRQEADRKGNARNSLADLILSQSPEGMGGHQPGSFATIASQASDPINGEPAQVSASSPSSKAWADYVHNDPTGALDYRKTTTDWQKHQFELAHTLNEGVMQILGGVHDQPSYDQAKNRARALYGRIGINVDDMNLPEQYSPEIVRDFQMQGMETRNQLTQLRNERKDEWDQTDDQMDNDRADENTASLLEDRDARRGETAQYHRTQAGIARERVATTRRGQDLTNSRPRAAGRSGTVRPTATGPKGEKVEWDGKTWVPVK